MEQQTERVDKTEEEPGVPLLEINLTDSPDELGRLRRQGDGRFQTQISDFSITVRELNAAHGTWDPQTNQAASLLILRIKLVDQDPSRGRRFKNVRIGVRFSSAAPGALPKDDPYLGSFAPGQDHAIGLVPTRVLRTKQKNGEIKLDIDANPAPIVTGGALGIENGWEWEREVLATVDGESYQRPMGRGRQGDNYIEWIISENQYARRIAQSVDVAILLRRPDNRPFKMEFINVKATVDTKYAIAAAAHTAAEQLKNLVGLKDEEDETYSFHVYDPTKQGIHPNKKSFKQSELHLLDETPVLEEYSFIHIFGDVRGVRKG